MGRNVPGEDEGWGILSRRGSSKEKVQQQGGVNCLENSKWSSLVGSTECVVRRRVRVRLEGRWVGW